MLEKLARGDSVDHALYYFRTAMRFEISDPAVDWLNRILALARSVREARAVKLDVYDVELRKVVMTIDPPIGERDVLLVVDIQNDFCPGGALAVPEGDRIVPLVNRLAQRFAHVVLTQDWHPPGHESFASSHPGKAPYDVVTVSYGPQVLWPDHCVQGTPGAAFHAGLDIPHAELVLRKGYRRAIDSYSAFYENDHATPTGLGGYLRERGLTRVVLAGLALDFCVRYSAEDARREGLAVAVVEDACRGIDINGSVAETRQTLARLGVQVINVDAIAAA